MALQLEATPAVQIETTLESNPQRYLPYTAESQLFGFVGILVAIPAAAASLVALRHLKAQLD